MLRLGTYCSFIKRAMALSHLSVSPILRLTSLVAPNSLATPLSLPLDLVWLLHQSLALHKNSLIISTKHIHSNSNICSRSGQRPRIILVCLPHTLPHLHLSFVVVVVRKYITYVGFFFSMFLLSLVQDPSVVWPPHQCLFIWLQHSLFH